jgi:putative phage-type endonuclease
LQTDVTIGASQIATILGQDPYSTPQDLCERLRTGTQIEDNEHMVRGRMLEDGLANWWAHLAGASELNKQVKALHSNGWARATPDGVAQVDGQTVILETKCPAAYKNWNQSKGLYPYHYHLQVVWQMGVCADDEIRPAYGELCAGPIYGKLLRFRIEPDPDLFALMLQKAEVFLNCVRDGSPLPSIFDPPPPVEPMP